MVKVSGPALSLDASGSIAGTMTFAKWKGRPYVRSLVKPSNPKSGGQTGIRAMFRFLAQQWASLTSGNHATWETRADVTTISPFNAYMAYNLFRFRNFLGATQEDPAIDTAFGGTLGVLGAVAGIRSITVTQAITVADNGWGLAFFRSPTGVFDSAFSNCIRILPFDGVNDIVLVDTPLDPGTYYYEVRAITDDGTLGPASAEVNDTVV